MMTVREVAAELEIDESRAYEVIRSSGIPYIRPTPRRIRVPRESFERWVAEQLEVGASRGGEAA